MASRKKITTIFLIFTILFMLSCSNFGAILENQITATATDPISSPTATPEILTDSDIIAGIQITLNDFSEASAKNDIELLTTTLDLENKPFSRFIKTRFASDQESYNGNGINDSYVVEYITQREY